MNNWETLTSIEFWKKVIVRAIWTFCEVFVATIGSTALIEQVNWKMVFSASILATIVSVAKSIVVGIPEMRG
jgi:hypothetical protein